VSDTSRNEDWVHNLLFNIVALGCYIGPCLSKYAQISQENVVVNTYPSGTTVVKASIANNFFFYNIRQCIIRDLNGESLTKAALVKIIGRKNCQNTQAIMLVANMASPAICPVRSTM
jgi:hypothetical protein